MAYSITIRIDDDGEDHFEVAHCTRTRGGIRNIGNPSYAADEAQRRLLETVTSAIQLLQPHVEFRDGTWTREAADNLRKALKLDAFS